MRTITVSDAAKAVVRRNTEKVQGKGRFDIFEELFADDFVVTHLRRETCFFANRKRVHALRCRAGGRKECSSPRFS